MPLQFTCILLYHPAKSCDQKSKYRRLRCLRKYFITTSGSFYRPIVPIILLFAKFLHFFGFVIGVSRYLSSTQAHRLSASVICLRVCHFLLIHFADSHRRGDSCSLTSTDSALTSGKIEVLPETSLVAHHQSDKRTLILDAKTAIEVRSREVAWFIILRVNFLGVHNALYYRLFQGSVRFGSGHLIDGIFTEPTLESGYNLVAVVPRGALALNVTELRHTQNYLGKRNRNS